MNNNTYLTGTLPSSSPNATTTIVNPRLPPTTDNNFQFMSQPMDQFSPIGTPTSLAKAPSLYHSQQHISLTGGNNGKNLESTYPIQQHLATETHTQHTWNMIQKQYDMGLSEPLNTSSTSSPLPSATQQNSPTSRDATSMNSTPPLPPLYQEIISPSTSSPTSTPAMDSSQQTFSLQHPSHSQMLQVNSSNETDAQQKLFFLESANNSLGNFNDTKNALQQQNNKSKPVDQTGQITQQHIHESSYSAGGSAFPSSSLSSSDLIRDQQPTNPSNQQNLAPASASSNHHKTPDQHTQNDSCNGKRLHQDGSAASSKGLGTPLSKKPKTDTTNQQTMSEQPKVAASLLSSQTKNIPFTAASFEHMTREQMIERLVFLENERMDLQQQLEQTQLQGAKHPKNSSADIANDDTTGKNSSKTGDDDEDDDDEVESISSGAEINATNDDKAEMKCLWKNCGSIRAGVRDLTDHIIAAHVGGGKPLYRCEWENCRRSHKPFTKRHKICNHLRVHTGERPFVCDKPGCEKRFSRLDSLTTHIKTHSTVRPFICHITGCEKAYYHARSLKKHLKLHEDEKAKENEFVNNALDTSGANLNPPTVAFTTTASSSDTQSLQQPGHHPQQHHTYPFVEGMSLPQFLLQPGSNITTASIRNEQMIDQSIIESAQSLFDPLAFQLPLQHNQQQQQQNQPQLQPQFMQLGENISQVTMPASTNHNINIMDTLQQQQQQSNERHQTGFNAPLPMVSGQPPMTQDGFCL